MQNTTFRAYHFQKITILGPFLQFVNKKHENHIFLFLVLFCLVAVFFNPAEDGEGAGGHFGTIKKTEKYLKRVFLELFCLVSVFVYLVGVG